MPFTLHQKDVLALRESYGVVSVDEFQNKSAGMQREARRLFIKANQVTNRNGELGELLLYLLTEWMLGAPQLLTKMPLKTNPNMPVHGADGIHIKFCTDTNRLLFFWGEAMLYADIGAGMESAVKSIAEALTDEKLRNEFALVSSNIDFSGFNEEAKAAILAYLDPMDEKSNERANVTTCLLAFNFAEYGELRKIPPSKVIEAFHANLLDVLPELAKKLADKLQAAGLQDETVEVFFFPVPSVQDLRDAFQAEIGWAHD